MALFKIEQMVVVIRKFRIEAKNEADAIIKVFDAEVEPESAELADLCDERGLRTELYPELVEELRQAGIMTDETVIPSICGIEQIDTSPDSISRSDLRVFGQSG